MADIGKRNQGLDRVVNFVSDAVCGINAVARDVLPDLVQILEGPG
jgi:hypothetical protein